MQTFVKRVQNLQMLKKINKQSVFLVMIINFVWAVGKIIFGVFSHLYFFCVSGANTLILGFTKRIYLKHLSTNDYHTRQRKALNLAILIIISGALFTFYMTRCFFLPDNTNYGLILSITIATFSFGELGLSIYKFSHASKSKDPLLRSSKASSLVSSLYAITLTQVALLSATNSTNNFYNGLTGIIMGSFSIILGIILLINILLYTPAKGNGI